MAALLQVDIFGLVSQYLERADVYVYAIADAYRVPHHMKQNMGIVTTEMLLDVDCIRRDPSILGRSVMTKKEHRILLDRLQGMPRDKVVADWFLREYYNLSEELRSTIFHGIIDVFHSWDDESEMSVAFRMICYPRANFPDTSSMIGLCRYDVILDYYTSYHATTCHISELIHSRVDLAGMVRFVGCQKLACSLCGMAKTADEYVCIIQAIREMYMHEYEYPNPPMALSEEHWKLIR